MKPPSHIHQLVLIAPVIFVIHFLEESPWFVEWFNSHVARGITSASFWRVNLTALIITLIAVGIEYLSRSGFSLTLVVGWLGFLMGANALFHVVAAVVDRDYVPGLVERIRCYQDTLGCMPFLLSKTKKYSK